MLCRECYSTIDDGLPRCPQCGARIGGHRSWVRWSARFALAAGVAAACWLGWFVRDAPPARQASLRTTTAQPAPPIEQEGTDVLPTTPSQDLANHSPACRLRLSGAVSIPGLALAGAWTGVLIAAENLPAESDPELDLRVQVVTDRPDYGFVLLATDTIDCTPAPAAREQTGPLSILVPMSDGRAGFRPVPVHTHDTRNGRVRLSADGRAVPAGLAVMNHRGEAVGLTVPGSRMLPALPTLAWLRHPSPIRAPLSDAIAARRALDPVAIVEDARAAVRTHGGAAESALREILGNLAVARTLAPSRELLIEIEQTDAAVARQLIRALLPGRESEALAVARQAWDRQALDRDARLADDLLLLIAGYTPVRTALDEWVSIAPKANNPQRARDVLIGRVLATASSSQDVPGSLLLVDSALRALGTEPRLQAEKSSLLSQQASRGQRVEVAIGPSGVAVTSVIIGGGQLDYIVDTGASLTTIPTAVADRLGLRSGANPPVTLQTASGTVRSVIVTVPSIQIGGIHLRDVRATVLDLPGQQGGLLGLDALQRLDVSIDRQRRVIVLENR